MIEKLCFVQVKHQNKNGYQKKLKNLVSLVSTDREFSLIDRMFLSIDRIGIENRSSHPETL